MLGGRESTDSPYPHFKNNRYVPKNPVKCAELQIFRLPRPLDLQRIASLERKFSDGGQKEHLVLGKDVRQDPG